MELILSNGKDYMTLHEKGVDFISSPFSCKAVDILEQVGVKKYKIGSGEINNFLMLEK